MKKLQKRLFMSLFIFLAMFMFVPTLALADETPLELMYGENQSALIVGLVVEVDEEKDQLTCEVLRVVSGSYFGDQVTINSSKRYDSATKQEVFSQPGEGILISLSKDNSFFSDVKKLEYGKRKVSIKKDRKIAFEPCSIGDDALIQWYANTGIKSYDYMYDNDYFSMDDEILFDVKTNTWYKDSLDSKYTAPDSQRKMVVIAVGLIFSIMAIALIVVGSKYRKLKNHSR